MIEFAVSHIIQHHYILCSAPLQIVNPKVMVSYIMVNFWSTSEKVMFTFSSCNPAVHLHLR